MLMIGIMWLYVMWVGLIMLSVLMILLFILYGVVMMFIFLIGMSVDLLLMKICMFWVWFDMLSSCRRFVFWLNMLNSLCSCVMLDERFVILSRLCLLEISMVFLVLGILVLVVMVVCISVVMLLCNWLILLCRWWCILLNDRLVKCVLMQLDVLVSCDGEQLCGVVSMWFCMLFLGVMMISRMCLLDRCMNLICLNMWLWCGVSMMFVNCDRFDSMFVVVVIICCCGLLVCSVFCIWCVMVLVLIGVLIVSIVLMNSWQLCGVGMWLVDVCGFDMRLSFFRLDIMLWIVVGFSLSLE